MPTLEHFLLHKRATEQVAAPAPLPAVECPRCKAVAAPRAKGSQLRCAKCGALLRAARPPGTPRI